MKKGFTLVELLAVIVILAIIALIATPIVLNVINQAQEGADARSIENYAKALETKYYADMMNEVNTNQKLSDIVLGTSDYKGDTVSCDKKLLTENKSLVLSGCTVGNRKTKYNYENGKATKISELTEPALSLEVCDDKICSKGTLYYDPVNNTKCDTWSDANSVTGTKSGCMRWYVIEVGSSNVTAILDHNTTAETRWSSTDDNTTGGDTV